MMIVIKRSMPNCNSLPMKKKESMFYLKYITPNSNNTVLFADKVSNNNSCAGITFRRKCCVQYVFFIEICEDIIGNDYYVGGTCPN